MTAQKCSPLISKLLKNVVLLLKNVVFNAQKCSPLNSETTMNKGFQENIKRYLKKILKKYLLFFEREDFLNFIFLKISPSAHFQRDVDPTQKVAYLPVGRFKEFNENIF